MEPLADRDPGEARKRRSRTLAAALLLLAAWGGGAGAAALQVPPPPTRRVNDYAGALTLAERDRLEQKLIQREGGSSNQIVVAILRSLEGQSLEDFSILLAQVWRVGQKGLDNGVIFLIFVEDRKMRIEVGYGLEANLTDAVASSILRDVVAPRFRQQRIADGISAGLDAIDQAIAGTYRASASSSASQRLAPTNPFLLLLVLFGVPAVLLLPWLLAFYLASRQHGWTGGSGGWGGSSSGGGGGSSGGDGGGFSGGGGGFGGGGASGEW